MPACRIALAIVAVLASSLPALAGPASLGIEFDRLQGEIGALRGVILAQATDGNAQRLAGFELRLNQLDEELRWLTGRLEELEFGQRQSQQRVDQLVADVDNRLRLLEGDELGTPRPDPLAVKPDTQTTTALATAPDPVPTAQPQPDRPPSVAVSRPAPATPSGTSAADGPVLGTLPADIVLGRGTSPSTPDPNTQPPQALQGDSAAQAPRAIYDTALAQLRTGDYAGAETTFASLVASHPDDALAPNAAYWIAETYYVRKDFGAAAQAFARNFRAYGAEAPKAPDNLLKLGMSLSSLGDRERACQTFDELGKRFPNTSAQISQAMRRESERAGCS